MRKFWIVACLALAGCVTNPMPDNYSGPVANIQDSFVPRSDYGIDVFFVSAVNGKMVQNAYAVTVEANRGRGAAMDPKGYRRNIPAAPTTLTLVGTTHYAAPIIGIFNPNFDISGDLQFTPEAGHNYRVLGHIGPEGCAVWMEDLATDALVGHRIEAKSC